MTIQTKEKFFYASGAVANGVKNDAFTFFLLFFYSNVIGLAPGLPSLATVSYTHLTLPTNREV